MTRYQNTSESELFTGDTSERQSFTMSTCTVKKKMVTKKFWNLNRVVLSYINVSKSCRRNGKQCRPSPDCFFSTPSGVVWSGSKLFVQTYLSKYVGSLCPPNRRGGGYILLLVRILSASTLLIFDSCLHSITWTNEWILTKLVQTHYWAGGKKLLDFGDLDLIFKVTPALWNFQILTKKACLHL